MTFTTGIICQAFNFSIASCDIMSHETPGCATRGQATAFSLLVIMTLHFQRGLPALHQPSDITSIQLGVYLCGKKERVEEWREQLRQACTTDCMPTPHLENVPSNSSHVLFSKQCHIVLPQAVIALDTNSMKSLDKTSSLIWIFFVVHNSFFNNAKCAQPWHAPHCHMTLGSQLVKRQTKLSIKPLRIGEKGSYLDEWAWSCWQRQKPVWWERRGLLFSSAQRWHWGHRGQHDPCDLHVILLYNRHC